MRNNENFRDYYELIKKIKEGTFGEIYEAKKKDNNEKRAIKIIDKNRIKSDFKNKNFRSPTEEDLKEYMDLINNTIKYMKIIEGRNNENNNAVKIYECFNTEAEYVIVMELCDCDLKDYLIKKQSLSISDIYNLLSQLNKSFKIMSENKIIHRNLDMEHILIKYENNEEKYIPKLYISNLCRQLKTEMRLSDIAKLSHYLAPEILNGDNYNEKSDLWSLGVIIYIIYFKRFPYSGKTQRQVYNQIISNGNKILQGTKDSDLNNLIKGLLTADTEKRFSWEDYFNHPFFIKYSKKSNKILEDNIKVCPKNEINYEENKRIDELKQQLNKYKIENEKLNEKINELEEEVKNERSINKKLEEKIKFLENSPANITLSSKDFLKSIMQKDKEIDKLRQKLARYPIELKEGEKLMTVNFASADNIIQHFSIICKNTDVFNVIEKKLYEDYKEYYDTENYFTVNGIKIHKLKTLDENNIVNNNTIILNKCEI